MPNNAGWLIVPVILYTLLMSPPSWSGELRPLTLPSTQQAYPPPPPAPARVPAPTTPDVYERFRQEVATLDERQKQEYRRTFQQSLDAAEFRRDWTAAAYYQELLNILNTGR